MQKVTDYTLLAESTVEQLANSVTERMGDGWVPSGTVVAFDGQLIQAMVKFEQA